MYTSFLSTWKLLSFNRTYCCAIPFNGFVVKRFKATALNIVENLEESTSKAAVTTTSTTNCATTLSCLQAHHHKRKPQVHAVELVDKCPTIEFPVTGPLIQKNIALEQKHKTPNLLHLVHTNRKLSFYDTSNAPSVEDTFRNVNVSQTKKRSSE
uniref:Uncharacterized protein n=1 Tax=Glossina morsitans morsitans TaxID=37546 RepID=A0A1B0GBY3_GLOMM